MFIDRYYKNLETYLKPNKVLVIYGPRQSGKTTLLKQFLAATGLRYKLDSGDNLRTREILGSQDFEKITQYAEGYELIAIDEAQRIPNIGIGLKILADQVTNLKIIATGSSSFELAGQIGEPLTGRKRTLTLFPFSQGELLRLYNRQELKNALNSFLIFGSYPEIAVAASKTDKAALLNELVNSYLLKDILGLEKIKNSKLLIDLLRLLAFQIGSEVSLSELGGRLGIDYKTVARYLDLLEKSFVIFELRGYSRNLRNEISRKSKYFFYDNGVRNAVISNINDMELRDDCGKLWENFLVSERLKTQICSEMLVNNYFWRTWTQKEIDWVEERSGKLFGYEFKFSDAAKVKPPKDFLKTYPEAQVSVISPGNYLDFLLLPENSSA